MELLFTLLFVFNGIVIGAIVASLSERLLGDEPCARLIRLLLSVGGGILYAVLCFNIGFGYGDITTGSLIIMFAPLVLVVIVAIIKYMYKK